MEERFRMPAVVLVLLLAAFALGGCGGAGKPSAIDSCALITAADAQAVLGGPVKAPEKPVEGEGVAVVTSCAYRSEASGLNHVTLIARRLDTSSSARSDFDQLKRDMEPQLNVTPSDVAGLGDGAFWAGGSVNQLAVLKGNAELLIMVNGSQGATPEAAARSLAEKALGRLR